jgi:uncharacterized protein (TIGR03118 family)
LLAFLVLGLGNTAFADNIYKTTNLVTDDQGVNSARITDPSLKNAWGISSSGASPFWVSDNATGVTTLYSVNPTTGDVAKVPLTVTIPPSGSGTPTGQVFNGGSQFGGDRFLFVSEDGTISGWRGALGTTAEVLQTGETANVYKGVALATVGTDSYLYAANFRAGKIDVLKGTPGAPNLTGSFTDPTLPGGYAPFNIQLIGGKLYVTYALQDGAKHDDMAGAGHGYVSVFDTQGNFLMRLASQGPLNSPWGLAIAPSTFGPFANDLLVGNFGDGTINAWNLTTNQFAGTLNGTNGKPLSIDGLWGLRVGNDGSGGNSQTVYFSAGPNGESNGLFGALTFVPEPSSIVLACIAGGVIATTCGIRRRRAKASS